MPPVDFDVLCGLLKTYNQKKRWYWGVINKTEQEEMISQLMKWRPYTDNSKKIKNQHQICQVKRWEELKNFITNIHQTITISFFFYK